MNIRDEVYCTKRNTITIAEPGSVFFHKWIVNLWRTYMSVCKDLSLPVKYLQYRIFSHLIKISLYNHYCHCTEIVFLIFKCERSWNYIGVGFLRTMQGRFCGEPWSDGSVVGHVPKLSCTWLEWDHFTEHFSKVRTCFLVVCFLFNVLLLHFSFEYQAEVWVEVGQ